MPHISYADRLNLLTRLVNHLPVLAKEAMCLSHGENNPDIHMACEYEIRPRVQNDTADDMQSLLGLRIVVLHISD
jgi:hypothetical protein